MTEASFATMELRRQRQPALLVGEQAGLPLSVGRDGIGCPLPEGVESFEPLFGAA
jgi:hypothetical protein